MTIDAIFPALFALLGAVLFLVLQGGGKSGDVKQLSLYMFAGAFLALMLALSGHHVRVGAL